jgi:hypothetical protein
MTTGSLGVVFFEMEIICPYCKKHIRPIRPEDQHPEDEPVDKVFRVLMDIQASQKDAWLMIDYDTNNEYNYYIVPPDNTVHNLQFASRDLRKGYAEIRVERARRKNLADLLLYIDFHKLVVTQCYVSTLDSDTDPTPVIEALISIAKGLQGLFFESQNYIAVHLLSAIRFSNLNYFHLTFGIDNLQNPYGKYSYHGENKTNTILFDPNNFSKQVRATCLVDKTAWHAMFFNVEKSNEWIHKMPNNQLWKTKKRIHPVAKDELPIYGHYPEQDKTIVPQDGFRGAREMARIRETIINEHY